MTKTPLTLVVPPEYMEWPEVEELRTRGDTIWSSKAFLLDLDVVDMVLGPNCYRMLPEMREFFLETVEQRRKAKRKERQK